MERKKITFDSFIRGVILGVIIIGILMLLKRLSSVLLPFFIAWLIAYLVYPLVTFFQYKLKLRNRIVSIFCALLTLLIVGAGAFYLLVPPMIQECGRLQTYWSNTFRTEHIIVMCPPLFPIFYEIISMLNL